MRHAMRIVLLALVAVLPGMAVLGSSGNKAHAQGSDIIPGHFIVQLRDGVSPFDLARANGLTIDHAYTSAFNGFSLATSDIVANLLARLPQVISVQPDRSVSLVDPVVSATVNVAAAQAAPTGLMRIGGSSDGIHQTLTNKGTGINVAIIDTGIDLNHPDLAGNAMPGTNCVAPGTDPVDDNGHGTHVAGTIAALDNGDGTVGVAPGSKVFAVKVLNAAGSGSWSQVICGIDWVRNNAAANGIRVANMSLGGTGIAGSARADCNYNTDALRTAICKTVKAGVMFVVAAGNNSGNAIFSTPAGYSEVMTVSALSDSDGKPGRLGPRPACRTSERDDYMAVFSNYGSPVDIAAPGVCISSLWMNGGYATISGTSMASPHVAAAAALYLAKYPTKTPAQVQAGLIALREPGPIPGDRDSSAALKEGVLKISSLNIP